jgi:Zn-dependent metalloprotease
MIHYHHRYCCKIIPDDILNKLPEQDKDDVDLDLFLRERRQFLLANPELKKKKIRKTHKEVRNLYDSKNQYNYSTSPIATDEQIHSSTESKFPALQLANRTYDFFHNKFDLESFDNENAPINVHVNFGQKYNNAFWDGLRMVFGTGDGTYFNTFLIQNVFTHEFTHAITEYKCGLKYEMQSGALNEHLSDVFAVCLDQRIAKQKPTAATWLIGEGVFNTSKINAKGLRSFKNELAYNDKTIGKDPQTKHMLDFKNLPNTNAGDWGGVHINSGILNRAFYEFCVLAETEIGDERNNYSWNGPASIWFQTYSRIKPESQFKEFALDTVSVCKRIQPQLEKQIRKAWKIVGVLQ